MLEHLLSCGRRMKVDDVSRYICSFLDLCSVTVPANRGVDPRIPWAMCSIPFRATLCCLRGASASSQAGMDSLPVGWQDGLSAGGTPCVSEMSATLDALCATLSPNQIRWWRTYGEKRADAVQSASTPCCCVRRFLFIRRHWVSMCLPAKPKKLLIHLLTCLSTRLLAHFHVPRCHTSSVERSTGSFSTGCSFTFICLHLCFSFMLPFSLCLSLSWMPSPCPPCSSFTPSHLLAFPLSLSVEVLSSPLFMESGCGCVAVRRSWQESRFSRIYCMFLRPTCHFQFDFSSSAINSHLHSNTLMCFRPIPDISRLTLTETDIKIDTHHHFVTPPLCVSP